MLELVNLSRKLSKDAYREHRPSLRRRLLELQQACWKARIPSVLVFEGWDASGKDPRSAADDGYVIVKFFFHISKKEQQKRYKKWQKDPSLSHGHREPDLMARVSTREGTPRTVRPRRGGGPVPPGDGAAPAAHEILEQIPDIRSVQALDLSPRQAG